MLEINFARVQDFFLFPTIENKYNILIHGIKWKASRNLFLNENNQFGMDQGPVSNIKTVLSTYGDFHVEDKTAVRTSYH